MPNWCKNNLKIIGNGEKVLELLELMKNDKGEMTFNRLVPMPDELKETTSPTPESVTEEERKKLRDKYGAENWYDWHCKNWGCKWDASESQFYEDDGQWMVTFTTPWGPPVEFVKNVSKQFPKMTFKMQFADESERDYPLGESTFSNGEEFTDGPLEGTPQAEEFADKVWSEEWVIDWNALKGKKEEDM